MQTTEILYRLSL